MNTFKDKPTKIQIIPYLNKDDHSKIINITPLLNMSSPLAWLLNNNKVVKRFYGHKNVWAYPLIQPRGKVATYFFKRL